MAQTSVPPVPYKVPMVGKDGLPTGPWAAFYRQILHRIGGHDALTNAELADSTLLSVVAKTSAYTATANDDVILCSGGVFTVSLPAAADNDGKVLTIKKTDSDLANIITIDGNASETIDGNATVTLNTANEVWRIVSDGTNWQVLEHRAVTEWATFTMTPGATVTAPTKGTTSTDTARWCRRGGRMLIRWDYYQTAAGAAGSGSYLFPLPESQTADSDRITADTTGFTARVGGGIYSHGAATTGFPDRALTVFLYDSTNLGAMYDVQGSGPSQRLNSAASAFGNAKSQISFQVEVPITGWWE